MQTFEWLSLIGVIIAGFWTLAEKLSKIEKALGGKVTFAICHENRHNCPLAKEIEELKNTIKEVKK